MNDKPHPDEIAYFLVESGRLDVLALVPHRDREELPTLSIIDWKTGKIPPSAEVLAGRPSCFIQTDLVQRVALRELPSLQVGRIEVSQVSLTTGEMVQAILTADEITAAKHLIRQMIEDRHKA